MTTIYNPTAILQQAQTYIIRAALKNGCIVSDSLLVKVANETNIHVPKAFSPNGDGRNDLLYPILVGIDELRYFRVYNRWGNLVYELKGVQSNIGWDGRYRGMVQPMEGYVWVAEAVDVLGKTIKAKGNTLLIR
jgi:gliding motility-associated-like protein